MSSLEVSASDVSLISFSTKYLYDYEINVSHKSPTTVETIDTLQLRIYIEENREPTQSPRTTTQVRTGLTENKFTNPFYDSNTDDYNYPVRNYYLHCKFYLNMYKCKNIISI